MDDTNSADPPPRVSVVGTGTMGSAMATRLLRAGLTVDVWSRHAESTAGLVGLGATAHADVADAVHGADVVLSVLPTGEITTAVMVDGSGLVGLRPGAVWAQMGTIGVAVTEQLSALAAYGRPDVVFVDAPVSGSRGPAESGQLLILASGPDGAASRLRPVFDALGRRTLWLGPAGGGSRMKLALNTWLAFQIEGAAEAASLARKLGIDPDALVDALHDSPLASPYGLSKLTKMLEGDDRPDFAIDLALKDLDLATSGAGSAAVPVAAAIATRWRGLVADGAAGLDVSAARLGLAGSGPAGADGTGGGRRRPVTG